MHTLTLTEVVIGFLVMWVLAAVAAERTLAVVVQVRRIGKGGA